MNIWKSHKKTAEKSKKRRTILLAVCALLAAMCFALWLSGRRLIVTAYTIPSGFTAPIRIVHLTDLHNREFGEDNIELISLVADQKPDLILITGDMLNRDEEDISVITALLPRLADIAPVYYGLGNHEVSWEKTFGRDITKVLENAGAAGIDLPPYQQFLNDTKDTIPAINSVGYYSNEADDFCRIDDADGREKEILDRYAQLQYNYIFDNENRNKVFFPG